MSKILIKASKDAPDSFSQGYFTAEKVDGHFEVEDRVFADSLIINGYGSEVEKRAETPAKPETKAQAKARKEAEAKAKARKEAEAKARAEAEAAEKMKAETEAQQTTETIQTSETDATTIKENLNNV